MNAYKYLVFILFFFITPVYSQTVRFTAAASSSQVGTGEVFEISYSVNANADNFTPPGFAPLQVVSGPNTSQSMSYVNGSMSASLSYSFDLVASKEGVYEIPPATIVVNGKRLRSNALKITVVKGRAAQAPRQQAPQYMDPGDMDEPSKPVKIGDNLFLRLEPSRTNAFVGQQINLKYKLYTRVSVLDLAVDKAPDLTGFWSEDLPNPDKQAEVQVENYKGKQYKVATLKETVLFPDHAGAIKIDPMSITLLVRQMAPAQSIIEEMMGGRTEDVKFIARSQPVTINIRPLPEAGKPVSFEGAVGKLSVSSSVDKKEVRANEAINYTVKISGSGNLKLLKAPLINFPADFDKFDPKITDDIKVGRDGVSGTRTYTFLLIPRHEGEFAIPAYTFSSFDPGSGRYITQQTEAIPLKVLKGNPSDNAVYASGGASEVKVLNKDIQFIQTGDPDLQNTSDDLFGSPLFYLLLLAGPIGIGIAWLIRRSQRKLNADPMAVKSRKAAAMAHKHLAEAAAQLRSSDTMRFYEAVSRGLFGYLSDRFHIEQAALNREHIARVLETKKVSDTTIQAVLSILDQCEMARYAPVSSTGSAAFLEQTKDIIYELEKNI